MPVDVKPRDLASCLLMLILSLSLSSANAQSDQSGAKIQGLGPLKIGSTTVDDLLRITNLQLKEIDNSDFDYYEDEFKNSQYAIDDNGVGLIEIINTGKKGKYGLEIKRSPEFGSGFRFIALSRLTIGEVIVGNIEMAFYHDTLFHVRCDGSQEIEDALTTKYGPGKLTRNKKIITCRYKNTGVEVQNEESSFSKSWMNGDIVATSYFEKYFDNDCKPSYISFFLVYSNRINTIWDAVSRANLANEKEQQEKLKKEKYKGFSP